MLDSNFSDCRRTHRILFLDHTAVLGGGEIALLRLIEHLDKDRYEPLVVLGSDGDLRILLDRRGIPTQVIPLVESVANARKETLGVRSLLRFGEIAQIWRYILKIARLIRAEKIDLIHTNSLKSDICGGLAARLAGVPCLWHVRDRIAADYLPAPVAILFRQLCHLLPSQVVVNSCATLHSLRTAKSSGEIPQMAPRNTDRIHVIYDGVDLPEPTQPPVSRSQVIAMIGRISPWKGQHIFVEAAAKALEQHPALRFQIVGSAMFGEETYEKTLRDRVIASGLEKSIEFIGFQKNVAEYLRTVQMLVHASVLPEPFGQVLIEGMAAEKPVIATNGGAVPEIVLDGTTGILVPMDDPAAMAAAMIRLIEHPEMGVEMGYAGYERVKRRFSIGRTAHDMERLYDSMIESRDSFKEIRAPRPMTQGDPMQRPGPTTSSSDAR